MSIFKKPFIYQNNAKLLDKENGFRFILKDLRKTSNSKQYFKYDLFVLRETQREPFLLQTPPITINSNLMNINTNTYTMYFSLKNLEYDTDIQNFYMLLTKIEHLVIQRLLKCYKFSTDYQDNNNLLNKKEQERDNFDLFINTDNNVSLSVDINKDSTTYYNRYKQRINENEVYNDCINTEKQKVLKMNSKCQLILELPSIWFELNSDNEIKKVRLNWTAIQIRILDVCSSSRITECLIEDEVKQPLCTQISLASPLLRGKIPPPPPLPPPGFFTPKKIILNIPSKTSNPKNTEKKELKPKNTNGFKPPTLEDLLSKLKSLKKTDKDKEKDSESD